MIGVTIGINRIYNSLAKLSTQCFKEMTGLDSIILGEKELKKSGLSHPASLKLMAFDFVGDDNIVYFDADWFCVKNWNPTTFSGEKSIIACNDFVLNIDFPKQYQDYDIHNFNNYHLNNLASHALPEIRNEYIKEIEAFSRIKLKYGKWINTGLWIANKKYHNEWLKKSLEFYISGVGHHPEYYEQPAMNLAIEKLGIEVNYLSRKYNTLVATRRKWPTYLNGLHVKVKHHQEFISKISNSEIKTTRQVQDYFYER